MQASSSRCLEQGSQGSDWPTWSGSRKDLPNMIATLTIRPAAEFRTFYQVLMKIIRTLRTTLKMMALAVIAVTADPAAARPANQERPRPQQSKHGDVGLHPSRYGGSRPAAEFRTFYQVLMKIIRTLRTT